jgi:hypothetical protein
MAHVAASVNRLHEADLLTAVNSLRRGIAPPNVKTDAPSADSETSDFQTLFGDAASESSSNSPTNGNSGTGATTSSPTSTSTSSNEATSASDSSVPTPESVFGASPWLADPVGKNLDGSEYSYNSWYFATPQAAAQVAQMLGGTVVSTNEFTAPGSPYVQQQPNLMVQMPDGNLVNAGIVASFYAHGYSQSYINTLISDEINGATTY